MHLEHIRHLGQSVQYYIDHHKLFAPNHRILVAISGGPDSVFLAYLLKVMGYSIGLAHVNYRLRGEDSDREEIRIKNLAKSWDISVYIHIVDLHERLAKSNGSLQMLAREERYRFFNDIIDQHSYHVCATAHHADDQVETYLMSWLKGNSFDIFTGIPKKRERYVRPLLGLRKNQILAALDADNIEYSIDYTNFQDTYQRNIIRNKIIPGLEGVNPNLHKQILERAEWSQKQTLMLRKLLASWYTKSVKVYRYYNQLDETTFLESGWQNELALLYAYTLEQWGLHGHQFWEGVKLSSSMTGKYIQFASDKVLYRTRKGLLFTHTKHISVKPLVLEDVDHMNEKGITIKWGIYNIYVRKYNTVIRWDKNPYVLFMDLDKLSFPLIFRTWQIGDRIQPFGMNHRKKISDIFIDEKYNPFEKHTAVIVESKENIVGISGYRIAESVKIDSQTKQILEIRFEPQT